MDPDPAPDRAQDPVPDPTIFFIVKTPNKKFFCLALYESTKCRYVNCKIDTGRLSRIPNSTVKPFLGTII